MDKVKSDMDKVKSDIAWELTIRDRRIAKLEAGLYKANHNNCSLRKMGFTYKD